MKLWIQSDQHFEINGLPRNALSAPGADVFVCAGDLMHNPQGGVQWLTKSIPIPSVYVVGNHEFYRGIYTTWREEGLQEASLHPDVHLLENAISVIDGVRFIGCTLWTDFALYGAETTEAAKETAASSMNDYRQIRYGTVNSWQLVDFKPNHAAKANEASRAFLESALAQPYHGKTVVVTHHAPHPRSIHPKYENNLLNASFASDLSGLIERTQPDLWVHGHVHSSFDYLVGKTRIIVNPKGYGNENPDFEPGLVVEL
jgi:predicted phosphodiesterase